MIKKLLALNGLAIIFAVAYHAAGWGFTALFWWTDRYLPVEVPNFDQMGSFNYFGLRLIEQVIIVAIPIFLFVSGYFIAFACGKNNEPKWKWIFTRLTYLVIPYLLWSVVMLVFNWLQGDHFRAIDLFSILLTGKAAAAYYFIPLLVQLYLLAPFLTKLIKTKPLLVLSIAACSKFS